MYNSKTCFNFASTNKGKQRESPAPRLEFNFHFFHNQNFMNFMNLSSLWTSIAEYSHQQQHDYNKAVFSFKHTKEELKELRGKIENTINSLRFIQMQMSEKDFEEIDLSFSYRKRLFLRIKQEALCNPCIYVKK